METIRKDARYESLDGEEWNTEFVSREDEDGKMLNIIQEVKTDNERYTQTVQLDITDMTILYYHLVEVLNKNNAQSLMD